MKAFVIFRDRVTYGRQCVEALEAAGLDVVVVDRNSHHPEACDWLAGIAEQEMDYGGYPQVWYSENGHPRDLWAPGGVLALNVEPDERFIVTDCDVIPDPGCPADWVTRMASLLDTYPAIRKVGLGLRTDDLPEHYEHRDKVRSWEAQYQAVGDGGHLRVWPGAAAVIADIDTTLAMYRRYEPFTLGPALRMRPPYVARHLSWYEDTANPTPEQVYYRDHAEHGHWRNPDSYTDTHALGGSQ